MICKDFKFKNKWLSDFDYVVAGSDDGQEFTGLEAITSELTAVRPYKEYYGMVYTDVLVLNINIIKKPCVYPDQSEALFSGDDINKLRAWLESPRKVSELMCITEDNRELFYYGSFTLTTPQNIGEYVYGLTLTFTCNAPYGYTAFENTEYEMENETELETTFYNQSCELDNYLYPIIEIIAESSFNNETVSLKNISDDNNEMQIKLPAGKTKINIDCQRKIITDENGSLIPMSNIGLTMPDNTDYDFISADKYLFYWFRLVSERNEIVFSVDTPVISAINIGAQFPYKSGGI